MSLSLSRAKVCIFRVMYNGINQGQNYAFYNDMVSLANAFFFFRFVFPHTVAQVQYRGYVIFKHNRALTFQCHSPDISLPNYCDAYSSQHNETLADSCSSVSGKGLHAFSISMYKSCKTCKKRNIILLKCHHTNIFPVSLGCDCTISLLTYFL